MSSPGAFGETEIRKGLARRGWFVIPTANIDEGGAPMARSCDRALILPDLQISAHGKSRWVEVKTKEKAAYYQIEQVYKHGFCLRQWEHYRHIERETGLQVWLFIWEVSTATICYAPLGYFKYQQIRRPGKFQVPSRGGRHDYCEHGMVFFRRDDFWQMDQAQFDAGTWNDTWIHTRTETLEKVPPQQPSLFPEPQP